MTRGRGVLVLLVTVLLVGCLSPFAIELVTSFKTDADASAHPLSLVPRPVSGDAWREVLRPEGLPTLRWLANSVLVTAVVTAGRVFLDSLAGYALSRLRFPGRRALLAGVLAVMAVPGVVLLVPKFLVVSYLGIYDTYAAMVLPLLVDATGVFIMKQLFDTLPPELEEAARLDGATVFQTFWYVVLPLAGPALATLTVLSFQGSWNELGHFLAVTGSPEHKTLVTGLADLTAGGLGAGSRHPLKMAVAVVTTLPVVVVFLLCQRHVLPGGREGGGR